MDNKVILTVFGVLLLLTGIFFFFKSFAGHEQRMQEEQRLRLEMERKRLDEERIAANRPLTPEEIAQRKKLEEEQRKADEARRVMEEKRRLEEQIAAEKAQAEAEKARAEEDHRRRLAEEQMAAAAARREEEDRIRREESEKACREQERKRLETAALSELQKWMDSNVERCIAASFMPAMNPGSTGPREPVYPFPRAEMGAVPADPRRYRSPDEIPGFLNWADETLLRFCRQAINVGAGGQESVVETPAVFRQIVLINDQVVLKDVHQKMAAQLFRLQDAIEKANSNMAAGRNLVSLGLRNVEDLEQRERLLWNSGSDEMASRDTVSNRGPTKAQILDGLRAEKQKALDKMRAQIVTYWRGVNDSRGTAAAIKLLSQAKQLVAERLKQLGGEDVRTVSSPNANAATGTAVPKPPAGYKIYVLKDGTEIKAFTVMHAGDEYAIKDETGEIKIVKVDDVQEIKKP